VIGQAITFYPNFGLEVLQYTITTKFEQNIMICKGLKKFLSIVFCSNEKDENL